MGETDNVKSIIFSTRLSIQTYARLVKIASAQNRNKNNTVVWLIEKEFAKQEGSNKNGKQKQN